MGGVLGDGLMRSIGEFGEGCQWEKAIGGMSNATQATGTGVRFIVPFGRRRVVYAKRSLAAGGWHKFQPPVDETAGYAGPHAVLSAPPYSGSVRAFHGGVGMSRDGCFGAKCAGCTGGSVGDFAECGR